MKRCMIVVASLLLAVVPLFPQTGENSPSPILFSLGANGDLNIPLGLNAQNYDIGGLGGVIAEIPIPSLSLFYIRLGIDYAVAPIRLQATQAPESLSVFAAKAGAGLRFALTPWLALKAFGEGGYNLGFLNSTGTSGGSGYLSGGLGADFTIIPAMTLGLTASYSAYLGLYGQMEVGLSLSYNILGDLSPASGTQTAPEPGPTPEPAPAPEPTPAPAPAPQPLKAAPQQLTGTDIEIGNVTFENVFPLFHKFYDDHPIGKMVIRNTTGVTATDVVVSFLVKQYMDAPKDYKALFDLQPGESLPVDLYALFKSSILDLTEATKVAAEISLAYKLNGQKYTQSKTETLRIYDRNAILWDDDRKVASFVTEKDPAVLTYSNSILGMTKDLTNRAVSKNLQLAMALHDALCANGIAYVPDPKTPYLNLSQRKEAIDFLKFPRQTLEYRGGDCDDLSILYSALFESIGIETAFITVPGHIFMAFSLDMTPDEARKNYSQSDSLIFQGNKTWVPIEITMREGGFLKAWQEGAREWRENSDAKLAGFYPVHDAWLLYEPVGLPGEPSANMPFPSQDKVQSAFTEELTAFVNREIASREADLKAQITKTQESAKSVNALGVLYARYDQMDKAEKQFQKVVAKTEYVPSLVNLGNIYFIKSDIEKALQFYMRASKKSPNDAKVLLCLARANHALENYYEAKKSYDQLKEIDPDLAAQFSYLELKGQEATRAADVAGVKEVVLWSDDN